jgi:pimeloyl-ACP methyl ester carboxylesterase
VKVALVHSKVKLALHELRSGRGRPLLLLHGLAEQTPAEVPPELRVWPGPIMGLDFTGHGRSSVPQGGGYTAELLMGDGDAALQHLGSATVVGRGLGAYVALLLAGARPKDVRGTILRDGPGMAGGGSRPSTPQIAWIDPALEGPPDPFALMELSRDLRPPDYATSFVRQATHLSSLPRPITVCATERPDWLRAVVEEPGVDVAPLAVALGYYATVD